MKLSSLNPFAKKPQPLDTPRPLHCIFYSHIWTVYLLAELKLVNAETDIILELATASHFAPALNPHANHQEDLSGLLAPNRHLHDLAGHFTDIPVPMVLAPQQATTVDTLLPALALVATDSSPIAKAVVLVHINDAAKFTDAYAHMDTFSIVWDVADYPNASLPALAQILADGGCLDQQRWAGVHLCNHPQRKLPDSDGRTSALRGLLSRFPRREAA